MPNSAARAFVLGGPDQRRATKITPDIKGVLAKKHVHLIIVSLQRLDTS
jgi:hypothetical protein